MKLHRKAKTTPASRAALVQRALAGEPYDLIATAAAPGAAATPERAPGTGPAGRMAGGRRSAAR